MLRSVLVLDEIGNVNGERAFLVILYELDQVPDFEAHLLKSLQRRALPEIRSDNFVYDLNLTVHLLYGRFPLKGLCNFRGVCNTFTCRMLRKNPRQLDVKDENVEA